MKKYLIFLVAIAYSIFFSITGCNIAEASGSPVKITVQTKNHTQFREIIINAIMITSIVDGVSIMGFSLNRGNCGGVYDLKLKGKIKDNTQNYYIPEPIFLEYGKQYRKEFICQDLLEMEIDTDKGSWAYSFK